MRLAYRDLHGARVEVKAVELDGVDVTLRPPLEARRLRLELPDGTVRDVRSVRPVGYGPGTSTAGYAQLDNEILAGVRLARLAAGTVYPGEVSRLVGYEAESAEPFALLEPSRGVTVGEYAGAMMFNERREFQASLLRGIRVLGAAGLAHRGISPDSVLWDGEQVQITDFSQATLIGAPRTVIGSPPWQAPEQRAGEGKSTGKVGPTDDMWAAGRLIFYVATGEELDDLSKLNRHPELAELLKDIIKAPEQRPTAQQLLRRLSMADAPPRPLAKDPDFERGRADFYAQRLRKHPQTGSQTGSRSAQPPPKFDFPEPRRRSRRLRPPSAATVLWVVLAALVAVALYLSVGR